MAKTETPNFRLLSFIKCKGLKGKCKKRIKQKLVDIKLNTPEFCFNCYEREVLGKTISRKERKHINKARRISA